MADLKCTYIDYCTTYTVYWTSWLNKPDVSLCFRFLVWLLQQAIIPGFHPLSPILDPRSSFTRKPVSCMSLHDSGNSWDMMLPPWSSRVERYCGNCQRERVFHHRSNSCANFETITCRLVDSGPVYEGTRVGFTELVAVTRPKSSWNSNYVLSREKTVNLTSILASGLDYLGTLTRPKVWRGVCFT